jgi:hypothetical protein
MAEQEPKPTRVTAQQYRQGRRDMLQPEDIQRNEIYRLRFINFEMGSYAVEGLVYVEYTQEKGDDLYVWYTTPFKELFDLHVSVDEIGRIFNPRLDDGLEKGYFLESPMPTETPDDELTTNRNNNLVLV